VKLEDCADSHIILTGYPEIKFDEDGQNTSPPVPSSSTKTAFRSASRLPPPQPWLCSDYPIPDDFANRGSTSKAWGTAPEVNKTD
jgi:hypothetical protein